MLILYEKMRKLTEQISYMRERESWDLGHILAILVLECHIYNIDNTHNILCT